MDIPKICIIALEGEVGSVMIDVDELGKRFGMPGCKVTERTGITRLLRFKPDEDIVQVSARVARRILDRYEPNKLNLRGVFATSNQTANYLIPGYAVQVAAELGLEHVLADQVGMGCAGGMQALRAAYDRLVVHSLLGELGSYLVVIGDATGRILDDTDRSTGMLFSEGVSVLLITNDASLSANAYEINRIGTESVLGPDVFSMRLGNPFGDKFRNKLSFFTMDGGKVYRFGIAAVAHFLRIVGAERFGEGWVLFPHQANLRMLTAMANRAGIPADRVYMDGIQRIGNTSPSAAFLGLEDGLRRHLFDLSDTVLLGVFGAELTVGAALLLPRGNPASIIAVR